jgi:hypothetical protein
MRSTTFCQFLAVCFSLTVWGASTAPVIAQGQGAVVLQGGTLIDGLGGAPLENAVIVIEGNRFTAVGAEGDVAIPANAEIIDLSGKYILPGLVDGKTNWNWPYGEAYLNWGVTSGFVDGGRNDEGIAERDAMNHGVYAGPRLHHGVVGIRGPRRELDGPQRYSPGAGSITPYSPEEARQITRDLIAAGADFIGIGDGDGPLEIWEAVAEEAHVAGLAISCRCMGPQLRGLEASRLGVTALIHAGNLGATLTSNPEKWANAGNTGRGGPEPTAPPDAFAEMDMSRVDGVIQELIANNAHVSPETVALARGGFYSIHESVQRDAETLFNDPELRAYYADYYYFDLLDNVRDAEEYVSPEIYEQRMAGYRNKAEFMRRFSAAGGKLIVSSDISQAAPGIGVHQEMHIMQADFDVPPMKIIQGATRWNADARGIEGIGSIEPGQFADVLILNSNPLDDITNTRDIHMVIKDGEIWERGYHAEYGARMFANNSQNDDRSVVANSDWAEVVRGSIPGRDRLPEGAPAPSPRISPTPVIDMIAPRTIIQGSPDTVVTLTGVSFVEGSKVYMAIAPDGDPENAGTPLTTRVVSNDVIEVTLPSHVLGSAGKLKLVVKNPTPINNAEWGDTSNTAHVLVPFSFTESYFSKVHDETKYW